MSRVPLTEDEIYRLQEDEKAKYRAKYGGQALTERYQITPEQAVVLLSPTGDFTVTLTPDMLRHLFFFNQQLHDGLSSLITLLSANAQGRAEDAARHSGIVVAAFESSDNHFRTFMGELLDRARRVEE